MKKIGSVQKLIICFLFMTLPFAQTEGLAAAGTHTVARGDTMWKIAVKYQIGLSELIKANPKITNPALIYPGLVIDIPNIDSIKTLENEVIRCW